MNNIFQSAVPLAAACALSSAVAFAADGPGTSGLWMKTFDFDDAVRLYIDGKLVLDNAQGGEVALSFRGEKLGRIAGAADTTASPAWTTDTTSPSPKAVPARSSCSATGPTGTKKTVNGS